MGKLYTVNEIAEKYGVTKHVVNGWIHDKNLPIFRRVGRRIYLRLDDVDQFLARETFYAQRKKENKARRLRVAG